MKYKTNISPSAKDWEDGLDEELSMEDMNKYLDEYLSEGDWDEDLLTDDFDEIDRKVEHFTARIAELEAELKRGGLHGRREEIEYKMEIFEDQRGILIGHKEILEGKGIPNEVVFAELQKELKNPSQALIPTWDGYVMNKYRKF